MPFLCFWRRRLLLQQQVHAHGKTQYDGENKYRKQLHDALHSRGGLACLHSAKGLVRFRSASIGRPRCATEHSYGEDEHGGNCSH